MDKNKNTSGYKICEDCKYYHREDDVSHYTDKCKHHNSRWFQKDDDVFIAFLIRGEIDYLPCYIARGVKYCEINGKWFELKNGDEK